LTFRKSGSDGIVLIVVPATPARIIGGFSRSTMAPAVAGADRMTIEEVVKEGAAR